MNFKSCGFVRTWDFNFIDLNSVKSVRSIINPYNLVIFLIALELVKKEQTNVEKVHKYLEIGRCGG
jgi:hypothetical protein